MKIKRIFTIGVIFLMICIVNTKASNQIYSPEIIKAILDETQELCSKDNGLLWGHSLDVPILFIDEENKIVYSNKNSSKLNLEERNNIYIGKLPDFIKVKKRSAKNRQTQLGYYTSSFA